MLGEALLGLLISLKAVAASSHSHLTWHFGGGGGQGGGVVSDAPGSASYKKNNLLLMLGLVVGIPGRAPDK